MGVLVVDAIILDEFCCYAKRNNQTLKNNHKEILTGLEDVDNRFLFVSSSSSSVKSTTSWEVGGGGGSGGGSSGGVAGFFNIDILFVIVVVVAVVVVVKQGINCCNDGPFVRIGVRKLLKGRIGTVVGLFAFGVECFPFVC